MANQKLEPQNIEAEENVLGAMMLSPAAVVSVTERTDLSASDFYRESHGQIFAAIIALDATGKPTDPIHVIEELKRAGQLKDIGQERVLELEAIVPAASNAPHWAQIVVEKAKFRKLGRAAREIHGLAQEPTEDADTTIDRAEELIFEIVQAGRQRGDWIDMETAVTEAHRLIREASESDRDVNGLATGFVLIDHMLSGLQPGNLVVLAARPSMGKTALALGIATNVIYDEKKPVGLFTMEMSSAEITQRILAATARVDSVAIRNGRLTSDDWSRVNEAAERLYRAPLFVDDSTESMVELRAKARRLKNRQPDLGLIVVDYLQLLTFGSDRYEGRVQDVSQISRALKILGRELEVPVLALSQLSRQVEQRHDKRPILSDLRESGAIEQDADAVAFIYRDEYYNPDDTDQHGIAEVNIAKHRNGPTGTIKLAFNGRHARFGDLLPD